MTLRSLTLAAALACLLVASAPLRGAAATADHLVLDEIVACVRVPASLFGSEFVRIANPTDQTVDLSRVYLTNATYRDGDALYWQLVEGPGGNAGGGSGGKFHCRFPDGATLAPGASVTIALNGSTEFFSAYGHEPDYELFEDAALQPDSVPEMVEAFPGAINRGLGTAGTNVPGSDGWLPDAAGSLVLYRWDGQSDLVQDLDYLFWGTSLSVRVDKTGIRVDGPDADSDSTAYLPDTPVADQHSVAMYSSSYVHNFGQALLRATAGDEGDETTTGGNGETGHDETSEPLDVTWQAGAQDATSDGGAASPAAIVTGTALTPAAPIADQPVAVTLTLQTPPDATIASATLYYSIDGGAWTDVAASDGGDGTWSADIPGQAEETTVAYWWTVTTDGGAVTTWPAGAPLWHESYLVNPAPVPGEGPAKLLLSEVCALGSDQEFIEIYNPNDFDVDLSNYYLTDAIYASGNQFYWRIVEGNPSQSTIGGGAYDDFHARFPDGAVLKSHAYAVVSLAGSDRFFNAFGIMPTYELTEDGEAPDDVPDMREVFPGSNQPGPPYDNQPGLSNSGEPVILYYWDGQSDLVTDIDIFVFGTSTSYRFSKNGVSIDGPDPDAVPTSYAPETQVSAQHPFALVHEFGYSFQRLSLDPGDEGQSVGSGNGVDGRDELSEDFAQTWTMDNEADPADTSLQDYSSELFLNVPARTFLPRLGEKLTINFPALPGSETIVRIFDLEGRVVRTLYDSRFQRPGPSKFIDWDGRDDRFELVKAGTYIVHLSSVDETTGHREELTAPAVVATRLSQ